MVTLGVSIIVFAALVFFVGLALWIRGNFASGLNVPGGGPAGPGPAPAGADGNFLKAIIEAIGNLIKSLFSNIVKNFKNANDAEQYQSNRRAMFMGTGVMQCGLIILVVGLALLGIGKLGDGTSTPTPSDTSTSTSTATSSSTASPS